MAKARTHHTQMRYGGRLAPMRQKKTKQENLMDNRQV